VASEVAGRSGRVEDVIDLASEAPVGIYLSIRATFHFRHILSLPYIEIFLVVRQVSPCGISAIRIVEHAINLPSFIPANLPKNGALALFGNPNVENLGFGDARFWLLVSCRFGIWYSFPALDCLCPRRNSCRLFPWPERQKCSLAVSLQRGPERNTQPPSSFEALWNATFRRCP
jgi:hypothetical protein